MEANSIRTLFGDRDKKFVVPEYQRAYAWEERQFSQFLDDLKECNQKYYYLGHFLFEKRDNVLYVIDGQQRLTTCIIFISVAVNALKHKQDEWRNDGCSYSLLNEITERYLIHHRQRFETVWYDNNFFADAIIEQNKSPSNSKDDAKTKSQQAIYNARVYFEKNLKDATVKEITSWIKTLENAFITTYSVQNKLLASQIFAYQNDRGKKLTNLEILKAYIMLIIYSKENNEDDIRYLDKAFAQIYQSIMKVSVDEDSVLNYYWRAISREGYNSRDVVSEVKKWIKSEEPNGKKDIEKSRDFVKGLLKSFDIVEKIEQDKDFYTENLKYMNNMAISYPVLIKAKLLNVSDDVFKRIIRFLENVTFRDLVRGGRADITSRLQVLIQNAKDKDSIDKQFNDQIDGFIRNLNTDLWWGYWSDSEMLNRVKSGAFYGNRVDNYLLWRYEQYLCQKNDQKTFKVQYSDVMSNESIEHIAPQTQNTLPEPGYGVYEDKENPNDGIISGEWMNCVGNLVLMEKNQNSSLGNKPFNEKLKAYENDNLLYQQKEVKEFVTDKDHPVWDKDAIERRFNKIISAVQEMWDLKKI